VAKPHDRAAENSRDAELVAAWKSGNARAGDRLVQIHFHDVRLYFLGRAPLEHEDLTQETFHRLAASLHAFREEAPFRAYLFILARNILCKYFHTRFKWDREPFDSSLAQITGSAMSSLMAEREDLRLLLDAMRQLDLDAQDLLELYYWQNLTARELGALFQVPEGTIRSRIRAALTRLKRAFLELSAGQHGRDIDEDEIERMLTELRAEVARRRSKPE
jgi:RNA polymerase sigma-70 factor (ECF subfamily)